MLVNLELVIILYIIFGFFEFNFSAESGQKFKGRARNIFFTAFFLASGALGTALIYKFIPINTHYLEYRGFIFSILVLIEYIFLTDLIFYWYHRAEHKFWSLWAIHELHHSDSELNVTTSMRSYWLERPIQTLIITIPINWLVGVDQLAATFLPLALTGWLVFTHANWKLRLGFLTSVLTGPQLHRTHHSKEEKHQNKNFAQFFPVLDIIFGTYYRPMADEFPPTGTSEMQSDTPIIKTMTRPFQMWSKYFRAHTELE